MACEILPVAMFSHHNLSTNTYQDSSVIADHNSICKGCETWWWGSPWLSSTPPPGILFPIFCWSFLSAISSHWLPQVEKGVLCSKLTSRVIVTRYFDHNTLMVSDRDDHDDNDVVRHGNNQIWENRQDPECGAGWGDQRRIGKSNLFQVISQKFISGDLSI